MRVISHALFGDRQFTFGAIVRANHLIFPRWEIRVYHDSPALIANPAVKRYAEAGLLTLVYAEENQALCRSMLWRLKPLFEDDVEVFISRDLDSLPMLKDRFMVEEFLESGAACHVINDNPQHTVPMMGGMTGFAPRLFRALSGAEMYPTWESLLIGWENLAEKGSDQYLMQHRLWEIAKFSACEHRLSGYSTTPGAVRSATKVVQRELPDVPSLLFETVPHPDPEHVPDGSTACCLGDSFSNYVGACGFRSDDAVSWFNDIIASSPVYAELKHRLETAEA